MIPYLCYSREKRGIRDEVGVFLLAFFFCLFLFPFFFKFILESNIVQNVVGGGFTTLSCVPFPLSLFLIPILLKEPIYTCMDWLPLFRGLALKPECAQLVNLFNLDIVKVSSPFVPFVYFFVDIVIWVCMLFPTCTSLVLLLFGVSVMSNVSVIYKV